jgi:hypothetical protein
VWKKSVATMCETRARAHGREIRATEARASIPMLGDHEPQRSAAIPILDQNRAPVDLWARQPADGARIGQRFRKSSRNPKVGMTAS